MFPTLRDAGSQLLFVTNAEITLEILSVLHYKSVGFGRPTAHALWASRCKRKGQQVKGAIHELDLHRGGVIVSTLLGECSFQRGKEKGGCELCEPTPWGKGEKGAGSRGLLCGGELVWEQGGSSGLSLQYHPPFLLISNFMTRGTLLMYWARPPFWWKWNLRCSQNNTLQQTQCL